MNRWRTQILGILRRLDVLELRQTAPGRWFSAAVTRLAGPTGYTYTKDVVKGDAIEIGEYTYGTPTIWNFGVRRNKVVIGRFCSIAPEVVILAGTDHPMKLASTYTFWSYANDWDPAKVVRPEDIRPEKPKSDVLIGNDVWIGWGAIILSNVSIGDGACIGAGAVVTRDVEPYTIVAGNPAQPIGKRFDDDTIHKLLEIQWWNWSPEKIKQNVDILSGEPAKLIKLESTHDQS